MISPLPDPAIGSAFDLEIGPDTLHGSPQSVRVMVVDVFLAPDRIRRVRVKAIGGGPTNVPRWESWPTLVYDVARFASMVTTGQLVKVDDVDARQRELNEQTYVEAIRKRWTA